MKPFTMTTELIMSIFEALSRKNILFPAFWAQLDRLPEKLRSKEIIHQGLVRLADSEYVQMFLTKKYLFYIKDKNQVFLAYIEWFKFYTFYEESEGEGSVFGFTLKSKLLTEDFYVKCETELIQWIKSFSNLVIMTGFDDYLVIIKSIDSGQFGEVYLCESIETHEQYAVKKIPKSKLNTVKTLSCLYNEIRIQRKLKHRFIVQLYQVFEDDDFVYLVMELIREGNLFKRIVHNPKTSEVEIKEFSRNLIETIEYIHEIGIIHRDIKPENIIMTTKDSICSFKLADFGLACFTEQHDRTCAGSPGYMAPEMLRGEAYSSKIDYFSIGVIIYILLTGFAPFGANSTHEILSKNLRCEISFNTFPVRKLSIDTRKFLKQILNPDQTKRPSGFELLHSDWLSPGKYCELDNTATTLKPDEGHDLPSFIKGA